MQDFVGGGFFRGLLFGLLLGLLPLAVSGCLEEIPGQGQEGEGEGEGAEGEGEGEGHEGEGEGREGEGEGWEGEGEGREGEGEGGEGEGESCVLLVSPARCEAQAGCHWETQRCDECDMPSSGSGEQGAPAFPCECGGVCVADALRPCAQLDEPDCRARDDCEYVVLPCACPADSGSEEGSGSGAAPPRCWCDEDNFQVSGVCQPRVPRDCSQRTPEQCVGDGLCELVDLPCPSSAADSSAGAKRADAEELPDPYYCEPVCVPVEPLPARCDLRTSAQCGLDGRCRLEVQELCAASAAREDSGAEEPYPLPPCEYIETCVPVEELPASCAARPAERCAEDGLCVLERIEYCASGEDDSGSGPGFAPEPCFVEETCVPVVVPAPSCLERSTEQCGLDGQCVLQWSEYCWFVSEGGADSDEAWCEEVLLCLPANAPGDPCQGLDLQACQADPRCRPVWTPQPCADCDPESGSGCQCADEVDYAGCELAVACQADADCGVGGTCWDGMCVFDPSPGPLPCDEEGACPVGLVCDACPVDPATGACGEPVCVVAPADECAAVQCPAGQTCEAGRCVAAVGEVVFLAYELTQCADPWAEWVCPMIYTPEGCIELYLERTVGVTIFSVQILREQGAREDCEACSCRSGDLLLVGSDPAGARVLVERYGFAVVQ